jgi:glycosyltransferase involved in cell wall biosynthesis
MGYHPLVSVVLPIYNDEPTLKRTLDSLVNQSYENKEILVVDDGSKDGSVRIVEEEAALHGRLTLLQIPHSGTSGAKNKGFEASKGEVVFFAEGDAVYEPDYLSEAVASLASEPTIAGVCVLGMPLVTRRTFASSCLYTEKLLVHQLIKEGKKGAYFSWVFRRSVLQEVGLYDTSLSQAEDKDLFERVKQAGYSFGLVPRTLWYHQRGETTAKFLRSIISKSRRRVAYVAKGRHWSELLKGSGGVILAVLFLALAVLDPWYLIPIGLLVIAGFAYRYWKVVELGRRTEATLSQLLMLPLFQLMRYMASSLGYVIGLAEWIAAR